MRHSPEMGVERPSGPASARQIAFIDHHELSRDLDLSADYASALISDFVKGRRGLSPTPKQEALLRQKGQWREGMSRGEAFDAIGRILRAEQARAVQATTPSPAWLCPPSLRPGRAARAV